MDLTHFARVRNGKVGIQRSLVLVTSYVTVTQRLTLFQCSVPAASLDALDILKRRFPMRGIDREGFEKRCRVLHLGDPLPAAALRSG
jgi:hypothetical protein